MDKLDGVTFRCLKSGLPNTLQMDAL